MRIGALVATAALGSCGGSAAVDTAQQGGSAPVTGTSLPTAVAQAHESGTAVNPAITSADNAFGLNLLNNLIAGNSGNIAVSPLSVALLLQILYGGAAGTTQQAMAQTLQLGNLGAQDVNDANAALQGSLYDPDPDVQLTVANSLWMHLSDNPVLPSFTAMDETYYGATLGDLSGAPDNVNAWVAGETDGLITQILPTAQPGYYQSAAVVAVLANTIYFKGQWNSPFDATLTAPAPFALSGGGLESVEMMHQSAEFGYFRGNGFQALQLPYGQGRLSMLIVLPDPGTSLNSLVGGITAQSLGSWIGQLRMSYGTVGLPRFTATFGSPLGAALTALGMGVAFCPNPADFSGIGALTCIDDVEHKTVVEVDEAGTTAAGATTGTVGVTVVQVPQYSMTMNRPFFYAVVDGKTGSLLFAGVLQDPNSPG